MSHSSGSADEACSSVSNPVPGARSSHAPRRFVTVIGVAVDSARRDEPLPTLEPESSRSEPRERVGSGVHAVGATVHRARFDDEPEAFAFTLSGLGEAHDGPSHREAPHEIFGDVLDAALALLAISSPDVG